jgi:hypothetical protein
MQCKDIPDLPILQFLAAHEGRWCTHFESVHMPSVLDAMPKDVPEKLAHAKMDMLHRRGLVDGCACGCRGDWEITAEGRQELVGLNYDEAIKRKHEKKRS